MTPLSTKRKVIASAVLILIVIASATQTEFANHLTEDMNFSKPYLTFYLTHSTFSIIFPLHLLVLKVKNPKNSTRGYVKSVIRVVSQQLAGEQAIWSDVRRRFAITILGLTALISIPSLCWFAAVPMTGVTDLTAIYATATFFTYGFSLLLLHTSLSRTIVCAIGIAFLGVLLIAFSGAHADKPAKVGGSEDVGPPHRILGDLIMLVGAAVLGLYEVVYKLSLPEGQGGIVHSEKVNKRTAMPVVAYAPVNQPYDGDVHPSPSPLPHIIHRRSSSLPVLMNNDGVLQEPHHLPIGLHANFLTSCIGLATFGLFWIPLPLLNAVGWEELRWPGKALQSIGVICLAGTTYNAGFMCLIGLLGPVTASVANLLAIGLVAVVDAAYLGRRIPFWTLLGAGLVGMGFGVLMYEGEGEAAGEVDEEEGDEGFVTEDYADTGSLDERRS